MTSPVTSSGRRLLAVVVALLAGALLVPGVASAAKVRSLQPWAAPNTYLVTADLDGRRAPRLNPVARVDHLKAGQWVRITCQVTGQPAYGSRIWLKVNGYFVPDRYVKTYTDGFLQGAPTCNANDQNPYVPAQPTAPSPATLAVIARAVEFERVGGSNYGRYKKLYPSSRKATNGKSINWGTNGCSVPEALAEAEIGFAGFKGKPVKYYSELFRKSCDRHDFGYRNFGSKSGGLAIDPSKAGKKAIDDHFRSNMKIQCSERFDRKVVEYVQRKFCNEIADTFWEAVTLFGGKNYFR